MNSTQQTPAKDWRSRLILGMSFCIGWVFSRDPISWPGLDTWARIAVNLTAAGLVVGFVVLLSGAVFKLVGKRDSHREKRMPS